ncbi:hypothetical protein PENVUL_c014G07498 [Penicillium vulpinum]|uniref:Uncharacterized protein n=1 Tax=Penicillium vulpinum TaxID=29845 RepID=A0A1V6RZL1_9EURO|nr:hypothetical protein PENVUL_c014G07498 [Penicillium vulpinum]
MEKCTYVDRRIKDGTGSLVQGHAVVRVCSESDRILTLGKCRRNLVDKILVLEKLSDVCNLSADDGIVGKENHVEVNDDVVMGGGIRLVVREQTGESHHAFTA